jgi:hypothetical protein
MDSAGNLYGTAFTGGDFGTNCLAGCGTVFELSPTDSGWVFSLLYAFAGGQDGQYPKAGVTMDPSGNLFGTTYIGGAYGVGIAFELTRESNGWSESIIHTFSGSPDGSYPGSGLTIDAAGNLYGTSVFGGKFQTCKLGCGTVFQLTNRNASWREKVVHNFTGGVDGAYPGIGGSLVMKENGQFFGSTLDGGVYGFGTIFELSQTARGWSESVLHSFTGGSDGAGPSAGVTIDAMHNLYETTGGGVSGWGTVFELQLQSRRWVTLHTFSLNGFDGVAPNGSLILDSLGHLYGTTSGGGRYMAGIVFEISVPR